MEAFHSFHHPSNIRAREIIRSKELGQVVETEGSFCIPPFLIPGSDIRYGNYGKEPKLAGGALMDAGGYAVNAARFFADAKVVECIKAELTQVYPQIDSAAKVQLGMTLPDGTSIISRVDCALSAPYPWLSLPTARVLCTNGTLEVKNFLFVERFSCSRLFGKQ